MVFRNAMQLLDHDAVRSFAQRSGWNVGANVVHEHANLLGALAISK